MKQLEHSMAADVPVLSSVQAWLGHELDSRGIDASVYSRHIVSLLQHDDLDGEHQDIMGIASLRKGVSSAGSVNSRHRNRKKPERKKTDDMSLDELRKMAAIDCLLSASEESSDIESLVEELYLKLKELQISDVTSGSPKRVLQEIQLQSDTVTIEDPKQKYYAAFPALSDKSSGNLPHNSVDGKVWAEVAARQTEMPGSSESPEECNNNKVRRVRKTQRSPAKEEKERQNFESKFRENEGRKGGGKGLFISPTNRSGYGYSCSPGSGSKHNRKNSPASNNSSKHSSPSTRYHTNRSRNVETTKGRALFQEPGGHPVSVNKGRRSDPGIMPPTFIVPKISPKKYSKTRTSLNRCRSEEKSEAADKTTLLYRCLSESVGGEELPHPDMLGELELLVEDLVWYTQPLDSIILPSPIPKQRLYQRNMAGEGEVTESDSETANTSVSNNGDEEMADGCRRADMEGNPDGKVGNIEIIRQTEGDIKDGLEDIMEVGDRCDSLSPMEEFENGEFCLKGENLEKTRNLEEIENCQKEKNWENHMEGYNAASEKTVDDSIISSIKCNLCDEMSNQHVADAYPTGDSHNSKEEQPWMPDLKSRIRKENERIDYNGKDHVPDLHFLEDHFKEVSRESSYGNLQEVFSLGFGYVPPNTPVHLKDMQNDALGLSNLVQLAEHMNSLSQESELEFELWSRRVTEEEEPDKCPEVVSQEDMFIQCEVIGQGEEGKTAYFEYEQVESCEELESPEEGDSDGVGMFPMVFEDLQNARAEIPTPLSTCSGDGLHTEDSYLLSSSGDEEELDDDQNLEEWVEKKDLDNPKATGEKNNITKSEESTPGRREASLSKYAVVLGHLDILKQLDLDSSGDSEALLASLQESEDEEESAGESEKNSSNILYPGDSDESVCNPGISSVCWDISELSGTWACHGVASIWAFGGGLSWGLTDVPMCNCAAGISLQSNQRMNLASLWNKCESVPSHPGCRPSPLREFFSPKVQHGQESRIWDINIQRKLDFTSPLEHSRALFSPMYFSQVNLSSIHMTFIKGGLYGNEWDRILDVSAEEMYTPIQSVTSQEESALPMLQSSLFRLHSESEGMLTWMQEDLLDQGLRLPGSMDLLPSENSAFTGVPRHSAEPAFNCAPLHHVQSEPIFSQDGAAVGRRCVDCQYRMIQVKHLYKSDTSILRQLGLATGTDAEETHQQDSIEYSPDRHFVPIHTAKECIVPSPTAILNGEENPLSTDLGEEDIVKNLTNRSSSYQLYLEEEQEEGSHDLSFVPSFRVQKDCEKCAQTGESPIIPKTSGKSSEIPEASREEEQEEEAAQEKALAERLLTDVGNVLEMEMCQEDLLNVKKDMDTSLMMQEASSDYESMVQDTSVEEYQSNVDVAHLWNDSTLMDKSCNGGSKVVQNIWEDSNVTTPTDKTGGGASSIWDEVPSFGISHLWQETSPPKEEGKSREQKVNRYMSIWSHGVDSQMLSIPLNIDGHTQSDNSNFDDHQPAEPNLGPCSLTEGDGAGTLGESMDSLTSQQSDTLTITEEQGDLLLDAFAATIDNFEDYIYQDVQDHKCEQEPSDMYISLPEDQSWQHEKMHSTQSKVKWSTGGESERWCGSHDDLWNCDADSGQETLLPEWMGTFHCEQPLHSVSASTGGEDWLPGKPLNDDGCWESENDMMFTLDNSHLVPAEGCVFSTELETRWLADPTTFSVQVPRKRIRHKQGGHDKKPCSFFLEGSCRRSDCKFAHDMSHITCRFWEEGECFKGVTCPFLHGYPNNTSHSAPVYHRRPRRKKKEEFHLQKQDFPTLSREQDDSSSMSASSGSERKRSLPSQDSADSDPSSVARGYCEDDTSSNHVEKTSSPRTKHAGKKKDRSKVKTRSLPIDIKFKRKT